MQNLTQLFDLTKTANNSRNEFDNQVHITSENACRTIYIADLPKSITYLDLSEFFEEKVGPCSISIKR